MRTKFYLSLPTTQLYRPCILIFIHFYVAR